MTDISSKGTCPFKTPDYASGVTAVSCGQDCHLYDKQADHCVLHQILFELSDLKNALSKFNLF